MSSTLDGRSVLQGFERGNAIEMCNARFYPDCHKCFLTQRDILCTG